jgi:1,4-dihydroxy-2-naphthoyl-CoA hydrolase
VSAPSLEGRLPGLLGMELLDAAEGRAAGRMELREELLAPNGFLHAGTVVTLADTCCGVGCLSSLPDGATGFTTVELKSNFLRSAGADDALRCEAALVHGGRTTQVWDATVTRESDGRAIALFRCTQYLLRA